DGRRRDVRRLVGRQRQPVVQSVSVVTVSDLSGQSGLARAAALAGAVERPVRPAALVERRPRAAAPRRPGLLLGQPPFGGMTIVARGRESVGSGRIPEGLAKTLRPNSRSPGRSYVNAARVDPARPLSMAQGRTRCAKRAGAVIDEVVTMMRFIGAL